MSEAQSLSADQFAEILAQAGVDPAVANATVGTYAAAKYDPKKRKLKPKNFFPSKKKVDIGNDQRTLRLMNPHDVRRCVPVVFNAVMAILAGKPESEVTEDINAFMTKAGAGGVFSLLSEELNKLEGDEYPEWAAAVLDEVALLASTDEFTLDAETLIGLPGAQFPELLLALWEVNKHDFLRVLLQVWMKIPSPFQALINLRVFIPVSRFMKNLKKQNEKSPNPSTDPSDGGTDYIGKLLSSFQSENTDTSPTQTSTPAVLAGSSS